MSNLSNDNGHITNDDKISSLTPIVNDGTRNVFIIVNTLVITTLLALAGVVTNVININVFIKMGFSETVNISLLGLAVSDCCSLLVILWHGVCINPLLEQADPPFLPNDVQFVTAGGLIMLFTRTSSWITAYVTFERYLCIAIPLKVKTIITPRRTVIVVVSIFILMMVSVAPNFYFNRLTWKFSPTRNRSVLSLYVTPDRDLVHSISSPINNILNQLGSFFIVFALTVALVTQLKKQTKWRQEKAANSKSNATVTARRDRKISKMVVWVAVIFIVGFTPMAASHIAIMIEPEFISTGFYGNLFNVFVSFSFMTQSASAMINIFFYVKMSTKYRETFNTIVCVQTKYGCITCT